MDVVVDDEGYQDPTIEEHRIVRTPSISLREVPDEDDGYQDVFPCNDDRSVIERKPSIPSLRSDPTEPPPLRLPPSDFSLRDYVLATGKGGSWNEKFQQLMEGRSEDPAKEMIRVNQLLDLSRRFDARALEIGEQIIQDLFLPMESRRYRPITHLLGGIAGGDKYVEDGILFKLALDSRGIYGEDAFAMKAAHHDLKSVMALIDCKIQGLHLPLLGVVHHRGYAMSAQAIIPIDGIRSHKYGSRDGGSSMKTDAHFIRLLGTACSILNLQPHYLNGVKVCGAGDMEGHLGTDGRSYVIDTARLFPPVHPINKARGSFLYRLFRPEFLQQLKFPLNSDAFSKFARVIFSS
eukprot:TRINITY_DN2986_c0_g1_i2.p1 TRINITY_DN2986_c0_g1~~TRINITY_DN2986_c0_g1_i2.p1  ORF type:complete len:349 (-),score=86.96 TRINITY_DN2986_c0_g1_i2:95-1141(-)